MELEQRPLRVLVQQEGASWVAQCVEYDIGAQAPDLVCLKRRIEMTLQIELEESINRTGQPFGGIPAPPDYVLEAWEAATGGFMSSGKLEGNADFSMKIAA